MPIIQMQKRARELGRIRLGAKSAKGAPTKLDKFRVTSASRPLLEKVAELYGGEVHEWTPAGGAAQFEVFTTANRLPILVPPQPVTQWMETWSAGGCVHRCDGETNMLTGDPCDPEDPQHVAAKPTTRLNVVLRDVEGIGVFRVESHGWNAAAELPNAAEFLAAAGGYIEGHLALEERVQKSEGKTRRFMVPIIEIAATPAELLAGQGAVHTPEVEGPVVAKAIEAASAVDWAALAADATTDQELKAIWQQIVAAGADTADLTDVFRGHVQRVHEQLVDEPTGEAIDAEEEPDREEVWQQVVTVAGKLGLNLWDVEARFRSDFDVDSLATATGFQMADFLAELQKEAAA